MISSNLANIKFFRILFAAVFLLVFVLTNLPQTASETTKNTAPTDGVLVLTGERLYSSWEGALQNAGWRYKAGDQLEWAAKDFDDSAWEILDNTMLDSRQLKNEAWNGQAWFRQHVVADEKVAGEIVALRFWHWGASEIYLDGKLIRSFGKIASIENSGKNADKSSGETEYNPRGLPVPLTFETSGEHVIAVRYSFSAAADLSSVKGAWLNHGDFRPGFSGYVQTAKNAIENNNENVRAFSDRKLYVGILYAFALLHFLMFVLYRQERPNLFYSVFAFSLANATISNNIYNGGNQAALVSACFFIVFAFSYGVAFVALQAFLYEAFAPRFSKFFRFTIILLGFQLLLIFVFLRDRMSFYATCVLLVISLADSLRLVGLAIARRREGAMIIAGGVLVLAVGILISILDEFKILPRTQLLGIINNVTLYVGFPIAVSIFLARKFARINRHLEAQLEQVKELSEKELEQSRRASALALEREQEKVKFALVEAENQRQAKELEEARQLQLSMLPKKLPVIPNLEIAAYMKPATEVGGDYYDFHVGTDGTLTVAVGDATGHGLKAGTVVTATKGLFNNLAHAPDIADTFGQISRSLKAMNLRGLFMALTMLKINGNRAFIGMAGMPSILIYRRATGQIEEVAIRAMPLGSFSKSAYVQRELTLSKGDCVVLMSDGFPEMFNEAGEMLADETAGDILRKNAAAPAEEIIKRFVETGEKWAGSRSPDDDVTFVILKVTSDGDDDL
jgi:serine phosphatase RsbU (regulator of sigma subunit)